LLPGTPSANDGVGEAEAGPVAGICDEVDVARPWPCFGSFLSSPVQETNSTMMPSNTAPSTTARRRQ
jgi:hypothetical protein